MCLFLIAYNWSLVNWSSSTTLVSGCMCMHYTEQVLHWTDENQKKKKKVIWLQCSSLTLAIIQQPYWDRVSDQCHQKRQPYWTLNSMSFSRLFSPCAWTHHLGLKKKKRKIFVMSHSNLITSASLWWSCYCEKVQGVSRRKKLENKEGEKKKKRNPWWQKEISGNLRSSVA